MDAIKPSKSIWIYFKGEITPDLICSSIADKIAGYGISYSAMELLKDLKLISLNTNKINQAGRVVLSHHLHERYHRCEDGIVIINPMVDKSNEG